jgi:hypothetical protein
VLGRVLAGIKRLDLMALPLAGESAVTCWDAKKRGDRLYHPEQSVSPSVLLLSNRIAYALWCRDVYDGVHKSN